jgi:putative Mg2+ transporter-C (MgtC) family protein
VVVSEMSSDPAFLVEVTARLVAAALLGAVLGLEREIHGHQAGMRTHMLVSLGSAAFTVLSIYAFPTSLGEGTSDPSRIAAQIVTGIGFLGAGAIIKYGTNIRGLTTAASLWVVASVGLAAGAGAYYVAAVCAIIALVALWPVRVIVDRMQLSARRSMRLRLKLSRLESLAAVSEVLLTAQVQTVGIDSQKAKKGHVVQIDLRLPGGESSHNLLETLEALPGVDVESLVHLEDA